jgi:hypothetical protein
MGRVLFIIISLGVGWVSQQWSMFAAGWLFVIPLAVVCLFLYLSTENNAENVVQKATN